MQFIYKKTQKNSFKSKKRQKQNAEFREINLY